MADSTAPSQIQLNVKGMFAEYWLCAWLIVIEKGPSELKLQITITTDKTVLDLKEAIAAESDVPADRQRLIYSGQYFIEWYAAIFWLKPDIYYTGRVMKVNVLLRGLVISY